MIQDYPKRFSKSPLKSFVKKFIIAVKKRMNAENLFSLEPFSGTSGSVPTIGVTEPSSAL